jgi:hypothetical protein
MIMSSTAFRFVLVLAAAFTAMPSAAEEDPVDPVILGAAGNYVILSKSGISTVPPSTITGNIAVSPIAATAMTGFSLVENPVGKYFESAQVVKGDNIGRAFSADATPPTPAHLTTAVSNMEAAYTDAASRPSQEGKNEIGAPVGTLGGELYGSSTNKLAPGVYTFTSNVIIGYNLHLSGSATDVFIFRTTGNLNQVGGTQVILHGGALAKNVFWQVAGSAEIGDGAHMQGILLVKTSILFKTGSILDGRALSQTACDLQVATITQPSA